MILSKNISHFFKNAALNCLKTCKINQNLETVPGPKLELDFAYWRIWSENIIQKRKLPPPPPLLHLHQVEIPG